jgi:hypothetical protein
MTALGLHRLIPRSLLAGRWIVVLVCYLDDSGKDPQNKITSLGGYIAREDEWRTFESEVEPWFTEFGVSGLHAKNLHDTDGDFKGWSKLRKHAFVARIYQVMSRHVPLGFSCGAVKETYKKRAKEREPKRTVTPYTFCFNVIVDWILTDIRIGKEAWSDGVSFILEAGHENNPEAEAQFYEIREIHKLENALRSICFVPKEHSRAIQVADLLAFYSRRYSAWLLEMSPDDRRKAKPQDTIINIIAEGVPLRSYVTLDFNPRINRSFSEP